MRVYTGREDNIFWRRLPDGKVEAAGARALCERDAEPLGHNIIHSVTNPISRLTGAIHVYGGDFFAAERSEWDPETLSPTTWKRPCACLKKQTDNNLVSNRDPLAGKRPPPNVHLCKRQ